MNIRQRRAFDRNDLLNEAYRQLAETSNRMDWIVVGLCALVLILVWVPGWLA